MYSFHDTTDLGNVIYSRPSEAVCYNGIWLDDEIEGFRTLNVKGRELAGRTIQSKRISNAYGERYTDSYYSPRKIIVTYQLLADSAEDFREKYNVLNGILAAEEAQLIFDDETDKYFIASKASNTEVDPGRNCVTGTIEFYCSDPRKYALIAKEFTGSVKNGIMTAHVINSGTVPASITYELDHSKDNGYIGIVSDQGVMEFGSIVEADATKAYVNENLIKMVQINSASNNVGGTDYLHPTHGTNGSLGTKTWSVEGENVTYLGLMSAGTAKGTSYGGLRTISVPADSSGETGAANWRVNYRAIFAAAEFGQTAEMSIACLTSDNKVIAAINIWKSDTTGNVAHFEMVGYDGKVLKSFNFRTSSIQSENPFHWPWTQSEFVKVGSQLRFYYDKNYTFDMPDITDLVCTKIQIAIKQYNGRSGSQYVTYAGFNNIVFQKIAVTKWNDIPNRYGEGNVVTINGEEAKIYVDGIPRQEDEILGTSYFKAPQGESDIQFHFSKWVTVNPTVKVRIREAWV